MSELFTLIPNTLVLHGAGVLEQLGTEVASWKCRRALIVTDPGIVAGGHVDKARDSLEAAGVAVGIYSEVRENPDTDDVAACVRAARGIEADVLIGLGGGSSMDTAKGANFILTNGGRMENYWGVDKAEKPMLPFVAIPTTAGTGSECQSFALIANAETHMKMACGDKKAAARLALLDPILTLTQPESVTILTGIDAISHAVETAVTKKRTDVSFECSKESFDLLDSSFERVLEDPDDMEARSKMQLGAAIAGVAIENSMLGAAHACANPLTAKFGTPHGQAVGVMLPHVVAANSEDDAVANAYSDFYEGDLESRLAGLLENSGLETRLRDLGIAESDLPDLAEEAAKQWTASFNPVTADTRFLEALYRAAW